MVLAGVGQAYTTYVRLKVLLERLAGPWPKGHTLDWGCGCGRVTRWLLEDRMPDVAVVGADIDSVSIRWCREHLDRGRFEELPLHPPTSFDDQQFSVILGISVFTHLPEQTQFEWLKELHRISKPGALVLTTTHGQSALSPANGLGVARGINEALVTA